MNDSIRIIGKLDLKNKPVIQSFTGSGAVGSIVSSYLVNLLDMKEVAHIQTDLLPPVALIKNGLIEHPIRIFQSNKITLMSCEIPIQYADIYPLIEILVELYIKQGASYIIPIAGIAKTKESKEKPKIYGISYKKEMLDFLEKKTIEPLYDGIVYGSYIETLSLCETRKYKNAFALLVECDSNTPAFHESQLLIEKMGEMFDFEFDKKTFEVVSDKIKTNIDEGVKLLKQEMIDRTRESHL